MYSRDTTVLTDFLSLTTCFNTFYQSTMVLKILSAVVNTCIAIQPSELCHKARAIHHLHMQDGITSPCIYSIQGEAAD